MFAIGNRLLSCIRINSCRRWLFKHVERVVVSNFSLRWFTFKSLVICISHRVCLWHFRSVLCIHALWMLGVFWDAISLMTMHYFNLWASNTLYIRFLILELLIPSLISYLFCRCMINWSFISLQLNLSR